MGTGEKHEGPEAVAAMLHYFYEVAFDATAKMRSISYADSKVILEMDFVGKHIGDFAGIPPTGKDVNVPTCIVYDVVDEKVTAGRVYMLGDVMLGQLGVLPG